MAPKTRKISTLIEQQLPGFISSEYVNFSKLVEKYYGQLEISGQPLDIINNITKYRDIDFYEENLLKQSTILVNNISNSNTSIVVEDATSFPKENGYIRINNEICFYKSRTNVEFQEVSRGVSGNTTLGDLYSETTFTSTESSQHSAGNTVYNISNLFLYAFIKNFEAQYLGALPEKYLKGEVDKRTLIKNINKFYKAKGTDKSIKFIFNSIVSRDADDIPEVYNPKDSTIKSSTSDWVSTYSLKVKVLSGDPLNLIGERLIQELDESKPDMLYASAIVDNVAFRGSTEEGEIYEIILDPSTINGTFEIASKTKLKKSVASNLTIGQKINVGSTLGWKSEGKILIGSEIIKYNSKNVSQFVIQQRGNPPSSHLVGSEVYSVSTVSGNGVKLLTLGVLYNLNPVVKAPYSEEKDPIQISDSGFETRNPIIFDTSTNLVRWIINENNTPPNIQSNLTLQSAVSEEIADVAAIYEDDQYYYICSSGYPSHDILSSEVNVNLVNQNLLRLIRKNPTVTTEVYHTGTRDVGIFVDGTLAINHRDEEFINFGKLTKINLLKSGTGYKKSPFILVNNQPGKAIANLSGEVLESISINTTETFNSIPEITITSGRGAEIDAIVTSGKITSLVIKNSGEYYSSPPIIRISDLSGRGKFAEFKAVVSPEGEIINFVKIDEGKFYTKENVIVDVIEDAKNNEAQAVAEIENWYFDRFKKNQTKVDNSNGYVFETYDSIGKSNKSYLYGRIANPKSLRVAVNDNLNSTFTEPTTKTHSPILGFAYDGVPIYGPFGYEDPVDSSSSIARLSSGYQVKVSRFEGPPTSQYPLGTFVEDYEWRPSVNTGKTELDENNGRFCVTPDYPNGIYAYFLTIDANNTPIFPYILGKNYYSLPVDSNYNSNISQSDLPVKSIRLRTPGIENNGSNIIAFIDSVTSGGISSGTVENSTDNFTVGSIVRIDNSNTAGQGAAALVSSVVGKNIVSLQSKDTKATEIKTLQTAYYFENDVITQPSTGATGILIGDVINDNQLVLKNVTGSFEVNEPIQSSINVINLIVNQNSSFSAGKIVSLFDGINSPVATGQILESTNNQNSLKIKVLTGQFVINNSLFLKSSDLIDTVGSKIITITSLSLGILPNFINENIAIAQTDEVHNLTIGDKITIDVNPDDSLTETQYYVRKRYYQNITLKIPNVVKQIADLGLGRFDLLNSGVDYSVGVYDNVELIFQNLDEARDNIGLPGNSGNARATIIVSGINGSNYGGAVQVLITNKGTGYRKGDILTVADNNLSRLVSSISTQRITLLVDHVGFAKTNTTLKLNSVSGISVNDFLKIGDEIVKVTLVNQLLKTATVLRGQQGTQITDHYNNKEVTSIGSTYRFTTGQRIQGTGLNDPYVYSYDPISQQLVLVFDYSSTTPNQLVRSNTFYDSSVPQKLVTISSTENARYRLEFSKNNVIFESNPIVQIQKYYKYNFNVSHFSMLDTYLDFSSSLNYNVFTEEKFVSSIPPGNPGSYLSIKLGFGPNIASNTFTEKKPINFTNYFYFIKVSNVDTQNSFLQIVDDPLTGEKEIIYATNNEFVYNLLEIPEYDGSGEINYTTTSKFAIGKINAVEIKNFGENYQRIPIVTGVDVSQEYEAAVSVVYDSIEKKIKGIAIVAGGKNYSQPKAVVVDGDGTGAEFDISLEQGSINRVTVINEGKNYSYLPTVKIIETDVKLYFSSEDIGIPQTVNIIENGYAFHSDKTLYYKFTSPVVLLLDNIGNNDFMVGEKVVQLNNGIVISSGVVSKNGYRPGSNILRLENITGVIDESLPIKGIVKNNTASIKAILSTVFSPNIKSFFDNQGKFSSDRGKISVASQKITDSFYYQDYSYVIKSKTPISVWRDLIKETIHPAGFKLFGEVSVESDGNISMPPSIETNKTQSITFIDLGAKNVSVIDTKRYVTETFVNLNDLKIERGRGSVSVDTFDNSETIAGEFILSTPFTGRLNPIDGQPIGNTVFTLIDKKSGLPISPYNEQQLIITLDGVLQEPEESYTVNGSEITFTYPPFGPNVVEGQYVTGQKFYGRYFRFKDTVLNSQYLRKLRSIESEFDGITSTFELYYDNGDIVKTTKNQNLIVTLNSVIQKAKFEQPFTDTDVENDPYLPSKNSYYILRSFDENITDKIVFSEPPIKHNDIEEDTQSQLSGGEKSFIYTIGSYLRLKINNNIIPYRRSGPFLIVDEVTEKVKKIDNSKYALVFIDGVIQVEGESYNISGPIITFTKPLNYFVSESGDKVYPDVSIILWYGRDIAQSLTVHDFEKDTYYNKLTLNILGSSTYAQFINWYGPIGTKEIWVYQNNIILGKLRSFRRISASLWTLTLLTQNKSYDENYLLQFSVLPNIGNASDLIITGSYQVSTSYAQNADGDQILSRSGSRYLYGSELDDKSWYEQTRSYANLHPGDLIKIDGEKTYREVFSIPSTAKTKDYRNLSFISNNIYSKILASNYNDIVRGEGLAVTANILDGKVVSLNWNRRELELFFQFNLLVQPTAYQYYTAPILQFIPNDTSGGGAKAEVIVNDGTVIDIILIDGGSDYEEPPSVIVTRGYDIVKNPNRKIDSISKLDLNIQFTIGRLITSSSIDVFNTKFESFDSIIIIGGTTENIFSRGITRIVQPISNVGSTNKPLKTEILTYGGFTRALNFGSVGSTSKKITLIVSVPFNIVSSTTVSFTDVEITRIFTNNINNAILENAVTSTNDVGAFLDLALTETDTIVYIADTRRFPDSSRLLIGKEIVVYSDKLPDRFLNVVRGTFGTIATTHEAGDYLRHLPELVSVVSAGSSIGIITEVIVTQTHVTSSSVTIILTASFDDVVNVSLADNTPVEVIRSQIVSVNNTDFDVSKEVTIIPPTTYATSLSSFTGSIVSFELAGIIGAISISNTVIVSVDLQIQVQIDNTDFDVSKEVTIIPPTTYVTSLNSYISTAVSYLLAGAVDPITTLKSIVNTIESVDGELTSIVSHNINNSDFVITKEIIISPSPTSVFVLNSYSSSFITKIYSGTSDPIQTITSLIGSLESSNTQFTNTIGIILDNTDFNVSKQLTIIPPTIYVTSFNSISTSRVIQIVGGLNNAAATSYVTVLNKLAKDADIQIFCKTGCIDYFVEPVALQDVIETRAADVILDDPYNQVYQRNENIILVENEFVNKEDYMYSYSVTNAGFTLKSFENNAFIDVGSFNVNGTIESISLAQPTLIIKDFEERPNSSITTSNIVFNLGLPSINSPGALIANNINSTQTFIEVQASATNPKALQYFPDSGKLIIGKEIVTYTAKTQTTFTGVVRGVDNTTAESHNAGDYLTTFN
jgi:hypothetical protein